MEEFKEVKILAHLYYKVMENETEAEAKTRAEDHIYAMAERDGIEVSVHEVLMND